MRQKILLFISILILNCFSVCAEEEALPQLPALPSANIIESQDQDYDQLSFFGKIKHFLGFDGQASNASDDPTRQEQEMDIAFPEQEVPIISDNNQEKTFFEKVKTFFGFGESLKDEPSASTVEPVTHDTEAPTEIDNLSNVTEEPDGNTDEGPMTVPLPTFNDEGEREVKLPSNFDDVSPVESDRKVIEKNAINTELPLLKALPQEDISNSDNKLELPTGFDDINYSAIEAEQMATGSESVIPPADQFQPPSDVNEVQENSKESTETSSDEVYNQTEDKLELPSGFEDEDLPEEAISASPIVENITDNSNKLAIPTTFDDVKAESADDINAVTTSSPEITDSSEKLLELSLPEFPGKDNDVSKLELPSPALDAVDNSELAVPDYVSEVDTQQIPENNILKYTKELQDKKQAFTPVDKISAAELSAGNNDKIEKYTEITSASLDKTQLQFVNNEAQVLILPNDDVVLGELTEEAEFDLIDLRSYAQIFWKKYYQIQREPERRVIEDFIKNYDDNFGNEEYLYSENVVVTSLNEAFKSIDKDNVYSLMAILNSYPVLQLTGDGANTLLHEASYVGNYSAARLLVLKGIDIFAKNENNQTALNVAEKFNNQHIVFLLKSANLK